MPELPEMENYKILLTEKVVGKKIIEVEVNREKSINVPIDQFKQVVEGKKIVKIGRRAKHLLFYLDNDQILLLHLMLGGWMFYGTEDEKPNRTIQVKLSFGVENLYFIGLRLGYLHLFSKGEIEERLKDLGPEPLEQDGFSLAIFQKMIENKRGILKTSLVDQGFIAGIGNCYSDEICFDAAILPMKKGAELGNNQIKILYSSIQNVLKEATREGGYMESPLYVGDQLTGGFDPQCKVYDREGEPCTRCGSPIIKEIISSKKTFYCKTCQH